MSTFFRPHLLGFRRHPFKDGTCESVIALGLYTAIKTSIILPESIIIIDQVLAFSIFFFFFLFNPNRPQLRVKPKSIITKTISFIMHFHLPTIALFSAAALLTFSYAHVASLNPRDEEPCPEGRPVCTSGRGHSKLIRLGRAMPLPSDPVFQNNLDQFMYARTRAASNVVTDDTSSTAVHSVLNGDAVNWAVKEMCGCSALIVVSESAMYFTHYFENLAFCGTRAQPSNFQREVLNALDNGATNQESLAAHQAEFRNQPGLAAFIMTPTTTKSAALQYRVKIDQLKNKVNSIIGIVPTVISYVPQDCETSTELGTNALGTALFQYDPNHQGTAPRGLAKVWVERTDAYTHTSPSGTDTSSPPHGSDSNSQNTGPNSSQNIGPNSSQNIGPDSA